MMTSVPMFLMSTIRASRHRPVTYPGRDCPARRLGNHAGLERGVGVLALTSRFPVSEHLFVADSRRD
jgi:hypothetical protein